MKATITLDAFSDLRLEGVVKQVDEFPLPPGWSSGNIKQYATYVDLVDPPPGIRPGLTANVEIHVDQIPDAIAVPVHALYEHKGEYYCLVKTDEGVEARWVDIGTSNDKQVVVKSGLSVDDNILENPDAFVADVSFPAPPASSLGKPKTLLVKASDPPAEAGDKGKGGKGSGDKAEGGRQGGRRGGRGGGDAGKRVLETFAKLDTNGDGLLTQDELPAEARDRMMLADADKDGKVTRAELSTSMSQRGRGKSGGGPGGPGGGGPGGPGGGGPNVPAGSFSGGGGGGGS
jgi:hypothetical protein